MPSTTTTTIIGLLMAIAALMGGAKPLLDFIQRWRRPDSIGTPKILDLDRKPRILIIDDDAKDLEQSRITLNGDYEVWTHRRPFRAMADLALEYDQGRAFDLIIIDYMMVPVNGPRFAQTVKLWEMESSLRSPMVFFTRMGKMIEKPLGIAAVWRKPEDNLILAQKVKEIIGH